MVKFCGVEDGTNKRTKDMKKGFTLIELVLVITILGILAVSALPSFINISTQAQQASRDGVVGAIRAGIALQRANDLVVMGAPGNYPATLDGANPAACGSGNPCFVGDVYAGTPGTQEILSQGLTDGNWSKTSNTVYTFNDGTTTFTYTYNPATGTFTTLAAPFAP